MRDLSSRCCLAVWGLMLGTLLALPAWATPQLVVVLNSDEGSLSIVDRRTMKEIDRRPVGREPHHLMLTPDGRELVIGSTITNELTFLDPVSGEMRRRLRNVLDPYQLGFSPDGRRLVTAAYRMNHVDIYDATQAGYPLLKRLPLHTLPSHMSFTRDSRLVLITLQGSNQLAAIDLVTQEVAWTADVGEAPAGVYVTADQRRAIVGLTGEDAVVVLDLETRSIVKRVVTGRGAHNIFRMPGDDSRILVTNRVEGTISLFDIPTLEVQATIQAPGGPDDLDFTPDGKQIWVTQRWRRKVMAIDLATRRILGIVNVGRSPHGIYINGPHTVSRSKEPPPEPTERTALTPAPFVPRVPLLPDMR